VSSVRSSSLFSRLCTNRTPSTPESSIFLSTASCHASPPLPLVPRSAALHFVPRLFSCTAIVVPAGALACAAASRRSCHALLPTRSGESGPQVVRALPHPPRPPRHLQSRILSTTSGPLLFAPPSELYNSSTPFLEKKKKLVIVFFGLITTLPSSLRPLNLSGPAVLVNRDGDEMSSRADSGLPPNLRVTIIAADGLYKRDVFRFPDPFAVATMNGEQTKTTSVSKRTLNPYWNEAFDLYA
jgi:hypothetical protein